MDLKSVVEENFTRYAGTVILDRAICDVRDMLKPSARMLTYSQLHITKNTNDKPFVKSARVVGDCLGHYYTHGDSSCYGTYMRMAKPFAMRYPLEECQGNSGTIAAAGDEAASRYTELRLSQLGTNLFNGIDKNTIDEWSNNFDETDTYPNVLPSKGFYNIVNGTTGIGVAISSGIPQFNLREINTSLIRLLWDENSPDSQIIVMPDFATGGILLNAKETKESLINGHGAACLIQSVIDYDSTNRCFKVRELPYGVYTSTITEQIQQLLESNPNCGIEGINDGSGKTPDYVIYLSKNADPNQTLKLLFKETSLQSFFTINMTVLKDGKTPKIMGLREMLLEYLKHQKHVYYKEYEFERDKILARLHILDGLLICMANIDEVVHTIKNSTSTNEAAQSLKTKFLLDDPQVKAILDMKLSRLAHLEVEKLENEYNQLKDQLQNILNILNDENLLKKEIEKDLRNIMNKYGDNRRTKIKDLVETDNENIEVKTKDVAVLLSKDKIIKAIDISELKTTSKGTKGTLIDKNLLDYCLATNKDKILLIDDEGNGQTIDVNLFLNTEMNLNFLTNFGNVIKIAKYQKMSYIIITTKQGYIKKTLLSEYNFNKKTQLLKLKDNDSIVSVGFVENDSYLLVINENHKVNNCFVKDLNTTSRLTYGSKMSYGILSATVANQSDTIITYDSEGKGKKTNFKEFPITSRTSSGVMVGENTIGISTIKGNNILICGQDNRMILCNEKEISSHSIKSIGSKLLNGTITKIETI